MSEVRHRDAEAQMAAMEAGGLVWARYRHNRYPWATVNTWVEEQQLDLEGRNVYFTVIYDLGREGNTNVQGLLLALETEVQVTLPNGVEAPGILVDVEVMEGGRLAELTVEIEPHYETLFYIHHDPVTMALVREA